MTNKDFVRVERRIAKSTAKPRRAGFELEFAGLEQDFVAQKIQACFGGDINVVNQAEVLIDTPDFGEFKVELDWAFGKYIARRRQAETTNEDPDDPLVKALLSVASELVPIEIVCPPIAFDHLPALEGMVAKLREGGAVGTFDSAIYAFGVHINPELPDLSAETIIAYLKAFCVAQNWLVSAHRVDLSRRITPYIDLFPDDYIREVLSYQGSETIEQLLEDYARHNPTRNRALDMTPLFAFLDEERLRSLIPDERINARPTFHYRLPNCDIDQENWSLADPWNIWAVIEFLSNRAELLDSMVDAWRDLDARLISFESPPWHAQLDEICKDLSSA